MAILFSDDTYRSAAIFQELQDNMPDIDFRKYPDIGNPDDIEYAIIWRPQKGSLQHLPNLKLIFTISAGVDGIIYDDTLPDVPIIRNTDPVLTTGITEYVIYNVLRYHRHFHIFDRQQQQKIWKQLPQIKPQHRVVGFMGLGAMARSGAQHLTALGFQVRGWSRTAKVIDGVTTFHGKDQLHNFLSTTQILVNLLPLTDETRGILKATLFAQLPKGAFVINAGRGPHLVEADLIAALDNGHLAAASLDVFDTEPLPEAHPFWVHPNITVTPHSAALTDRTATAHAILAQIARFEQGEIPSPLVERKRQY